MHKLEITISSHDVGNLSYPNYWRYMPGWTSRMDPGLRGGSAKLHMPATILRASLLKALRFQRA
eukprot:CAMPEP_0114235930 /NCGR_PEP_ID=MMETSP0058-20121206/6527_1 /TAXON_ID=36894 /ORGANISM="Pyramimonas parkeae, CCMP726" /LENGTH=63 /DNA_ID=CAMNT_0001347753 /DNA_START=612 /DNA_END=803 /DNA_ORIENTATION=-